MNDSIISIDLEFQSFPNRHAFQDPEPVNIMMVLFESALFWEAKVTAKVISPMGRFFHAHFPENISIAVSIPESGAYAAIITDIRAEDNAGSIQGQ